MEPADLQIKILQLPAEILFKIMDLAGCSTANHTIRYVCKHFYKVYCAFTSCGLTFVSNEVNTSIQLYQKSKP